MGKSVIGKDNIRCKIVQLPEKIFPGFDDPQRRILCTNIDNVAILNIYIPNGSEVGSDKYRYKLEWLSHLQNFTDTLVNRYENVVLLGDFNIAPEDRDVHNPGAWEGMKCDTSYRPGRRT